MTWYVYVLLNEGGTSYTGIAKDVAARIDRHNAGTGARFTRGRGPWRVVHVEGPFEHGDALRREAAIKRDAAFKAGLKATHRAGSAADFHTDAARLPAVPGAYVLLVEIAQEVVVRLPRRPEAVLAPGRYLYCGSACGPGGIAARVSRHMRRDKAVRWHIDRLTEAGSVLGAWVFPNGNECALVARLSVLPVPMTGFGSTDCRSCASHLLAWPERMDLPFSRVAVGRAPP